MRKRKADKASIRKVKRILVNINPQTKIELTQAKKWLGLTQERTLELAINRLCADVEHGYISLKKREDKTEDGTLIF